MTQELTGRELDAAVAEAMGWTRLNCKKSSPEFWWGYLLNGGSRTIPAYSAPDYSGFAAVLAWLTENRPTQDDMRDFGEGPSAPASLEFEEGLAEYPEHRWSAAYGYPTELKGWRIAEIEDAATLPEAACRLVIAWAKIKRERGWS